MLTNSQEKTEVSELEEKVRKGPSATQQAIGIQFNYLTLKRQMQEDLDCKVTNEAAVAMAAVLDYLTQEVLVNAGNYVAYKPDEKNHVIKEHHIIAAIEMDNELRLTFKK